MSYISLDNGRTHLTAAEAMTHIKARSLWPVIAPLMDDDTREQVHLELATFLARYLELAGEDLIIG